MADHWIIWADLGSVYPEPRIRACAQCCASSFLALAFRNFSCLKQHLPPCGLARRIIYSSAQKSLLLLRHMMVKVAASWDLSRRVMKIQVRLTAQTLVRLLDQTAPPPSCQRFFHKTRALLFFVPPSPSRHFASLSFVLPPSFLLHSLFLSRPVSRPKQAKTRPKQRNTRNTRKKAWTSSA